MQFLSEQYSVVSLIGKTNTKLMECGRRTKRGGVTLGVFGEKRDRRTDRHLAGHAHKKTLHCCKNFGKALVFKSLFNCCVMSLVVLKKFSADPVSHHSVLTCASFSSSFCIAHFVECNTQCKNGFSFSIVLLQSFFPYAGHFSAETRMQLVFQTCQLSCGAFDCEWGAFLPIQKIWLIFKMSLRKANLFCHCSTRMCGSSFNNFEKGTHGRTLPVTEWFLMSGVIVMTN